MDEKNWTGRHLWDLVNFMASNGCMSSGNVFRGQSNVEWKLVPSLYRREVNIFGELSVQERYKIAEDRMLNAFFDRGKLLLPNYQRDEITDRIIAQHYGVPTQLLDWTVDPLIAVYFATEKGDKQSDAAVYYIQPNSTADLSMNVVVPYEGPVRRIVPPLIDDRVRSQKGTFTMQSFGEGEDFVPLDDRELSNGEVSSFGKVTIPKESKQQVLFDLMHIGIDSSLVYPGLQGIGDRIGKLAEIQRYGGSQFI